MGFIEKMLVSIPENWYIFLAAMGAVVCLFFVDNSNKKIDESFELWKNQNFYSSMIYKRLTIAYSLFVTLITIFPLLGMFGTVVALLRLNFVDENAVLNARNNFFDALTSTAWGILFAIVFKVFNAFLSNHAEDNIGKVSELINNKAEKR